MGRGLGDLQKGILSLLLARGPLLRVRVLLSQLLDWPGIPGDSRVFDRVTIGEKYNSGYATMSRSLERLRRRGMVQVYRNIRGVGRVAGLTRLGIEMARNLDKSVKREV
jgi:hypothetical protein